MFWIHFKWWLSCLGFGVVRLAEHIIPLRPSPQITRFYKNIAILPCTALVYGVFTYPLSMYASPHDVTSIPSWYVWMLEWICLDLFLYLLHRSFHEVSWMWKMHRIHHLDEHLDVSSALRFHPLEIIVAALFRAVWIFVFSLHLVCVVSFEVLVLLMTMFHHGNIRLPDIVEKILYGVIMTPGRHWVHHHEKTSDTNSNYATILSVWDKCFNTRSQTLRDRVGRIGLPDQIDLTWLGLMVEPFKKIKINSKPKF